jgi:hypothetical protein
MNGMNTLNGHTVFFAETSIFDCKLQQEVCIVALLLDLLKDVVEGDVEFGLKLELKNIIYLGKGKMST